MAKRKRLTPVDPDRIASPAFETKSAPGPFGGPQDVPDTGDAPTARPTLARRPAPIAEVAGAAASQAALDELAGTLETARREGRMVVQVPLERIRTDHIARDRLVLDEEEMAALMQSIRARGQQTPVELVPLPDEARGEDRGGGGYGLISGWRRCEALARLHRETGEDRFATALALLRQPGEASEPYIAMVEENEIRVGLSYYERARIVARAVELGVFRDETEALESLFHAASTAKRSKIGSFLTLVEQLGGALRFPAALSERAGLALARALLRDPGLGPRLRQALEAARPADAEAEQSLLMTRAGLTDQGRTRPAEPDTGGTPDSSSAAPAPSSGSSSGSAAGRSGAGAGEGPDLPAADPEPPERIGIGLYLSRGEHGRLEITGHRVTDGFRETLRAWLAQKV